ncbi:unnamed protein product [Boreogadus saida]
MPHKESPSAGPMRGGAGSRRLCIDDPFRAHIFSLPLRVQRTRRSRREITLGYEALRTTSLRPPPLIKSSFAILWVLAPPVVLAYHSRR